MSQDIVSSIPLFSSLPPEDAQAIVAGLQRKTLADGSVFIQEGDVGDELYILLSGEVEIIKALGSEGERLLHVGARGTVVGEMSLLDPAMTRAASVRTRGTSELLVMTRQGFEEMLARYPTASLTILQSLSRRLRRTDNATIEELRHKNRELDRANADLKAAQARLIEQEVLANELRNARAIQQQMLPRSLPRIHGIEIGATMIPARMVGGDLYDVVELDDGKLILVIGDVAGKGVPAALVMALVASLLRAAARAGLPADMVLQHVNHQLCERDMDSMFVTVLYLELDRDQRTLTYVRAGHDIPLVWNRQGRLDLPCPARSTALGLVDDVLLDRQTIRFEPGTVVLAYTDGVTEAMNTAGEIFGRQQLVAHTLTVADQPAQAICDHIVGVVDAHLQGARQSDDITMIAVRLA